MDFRLRRPGKFSYVCPLCRSEQHTNTVHKIQLYHHLQIGLATVFFVIVFWSIMGVKGAVSYFAFWAVFETVFRLRRRNSWICGDCGFDPFLYKRDPKLAREKVRVYWQDRIAKENPFGGRKLKNYEYAPASAEADAEASSAEASLAEVAGLANSNAMHGDLPIDPKSENLTVPKL